MNTLSRSQRTELSGLSHRARRILEGTLFLVAVIASLGCVARARAAFSPGLSVQVSNIAGGGFRYQYQLANPATSDFRVQEFALAISNGVEIGSIETPNGWEVRRLSGVFDLIWSTEFDHIRPGASLSFAFLSTNPAGPIPYSSTGLNLFDRNLDEVLEGRIQGPVTPAGDYDEDGDIDGADLLIWQRNFGSSGLDVAGDGNHDDNVDAADLALWSSNFGTPPGPGTLNGQSVPEPPAVALIGLAALTASIHGQPARSGVCSRRAPR